MLKKIFIPLMLGASIAIAMPVLSSPVSAYGYNNRNTYSRNSYYRGTYNELASASEVLQAGTVIPARHYNWTGPDYTGTDQTDSENPEAL